MKHDNMKGAVDVWELYPAAVVYEPNQICEKRRGAEIGTHALQLQLQSGSHVCGRGAEKLTMRRSRRRGEDGVLGGVSTREEEEEGL
jgi:hypothetical protein